MRKSGISFRDQWYKSVHGGIWATPPRFPEPWTKRQKNRLALVPGNKDRYEVTITDTGFVGAASVSLDETMRRDALALSPIFSTE